MIAALLLVLALAPLAAQDFEDRLPGEVPTGWGVAWGAVRDDAWGISNIAPWRGRGCLALERREGTADGPYGISTRLGGVPGPGRLVVHLRLSGPATQLPGIELRSGPERRDWTVLGFRDRLVTVAGRQAGAWEPGRWFRLRLDWPRAGGPGEAQVDDGAPVPVELRPRSPWLDCMICPRGRGVALALDDLEWTPVPGAAP